jgi:hypothetical protein
MKRRALYRDSIVPNQQKETAHCEAVLLVLYKKRLQNRGIVVIVTLFEKQGNEQQDIFRLARKATAARLCALQKSLTQLGGK